METATIKALKLLGANRKRMTRQQFRTIKGQILSGDIAGAYRGIQKIQINYKNKRMEATP